MSPLDLSFRYDQLPPEGRAFAGELPATTIAEAVAGLVGDLGYRADGPATVDGMVYPARADVVVEGRLRVSLGFDCVRCLEPRTLEVDTRSQHVLVKRSAGPKKSNDEPIEVDDLDAPPEHEFDGETVALADVFREDLLLTLPMNPSCELTGADACELVAPQDQAAVVDPRWAPLMALRAKLGEPGGDS